MVKTVAKNDWLERLLPWLLVIAGTVALIASFILIIERIDGLKNPEFTPVCDLNPIFSCSSVTASPQASTFGFANPLIGIAGFAALITVGLGMLAKARFARWFWLAVQAGLVFAIGFVFYLQFQSLYRIGALCLFCMIVWATTIPIFWYVTLYNIKNGHIKLPGRLKTVRDFVLRHHLDILVVWYLAIIALILKRFWYYWSSLI